MELKNVLNNVKAQPQYKVGRQLNDLTRQNYRYKNLNSQNRGLIKDLIGKHTDNIRKGRGISSDTIRRESYKLYQNREKLGLTPNDLKDVKEILNTFKK